MMKCKFCLAEVEDGLDRCPVCGKDLEEAEEKIAAEEVPAEEAPAGEAPLEEVPAEGSAVEESPEEAPASKKATPGKIALAVAAIVVLVAVLAGLILFGMQDKSQAPAETEAAQMATVPADGEPGTVTEKGTYTVSDEDVVANKDTVVATIGDKTLTNGQLQVYYWMGYHNFVTANYSYAQYFGLDLTQPLDVQIMNPALHGRDQTLTWQQYFLQFALDSWQQVQAVALEAEAAGMEMDPMDQESLDTLGETLEESIVQYDVTLDEYFAMNFGAGAGLEEYRHYQYVYFRGAPYYAAETARMRPSDEELEAYFDAHAEEYADGGITKDTKYVDVRHILLQPDLPLEDGTISDESWAECEQRAQALLDQYLAGPHTEEAFAALANEHSTDPGSNTNGGLYQDVYVGQMVAPFEEWCFDENRQVGDTGLVKTDYGYHIMYFVGGQGEVWKDYAAADWVSENTNVLLEAAISKHPMEVYYDKISLGLLADR